VKKARKVKRETMEYKAFKVLKVIRGSKAIPVCKENKVLQVQRETREFKA
jgi:hypothetical protein